MVAAIEYAQIDCPSCFESILVAIDMTASPTQFSYDCEVCCKPMQVKVGVDEEGMPVVGAEAES